MTGTPQTSKRSPKTSPKTLAFIAATLASAAAAASIALAYPQPVAHPLLGEEWQCSRTAFLTSCTRIDPPAPMVQSLRVNPIALRGA